MRAGDPSGFTFVEILAALGVLGILLLVAVPRLVVPETLSTSVLARQIAVDLRLAFTLSIAKRGFYTLEFSPATAPYTSYTVRKESTLAVEADSPKDIPGGITVSGRRTFCFATGGAIDDDCLGPGTVGTDGSVVVAAGTDTTTVQVIAYTGRVKVVRP